MSRENFVLKLHTQKDVPVYALVHNITTLHVVEETVGKDKLTKTCVKFRDGEEVRVIEMPEAIIQMGEKYGVMRELK